MSKYTIEFLEQVTTNTGKIKANCLLKDEQGQDHDAVTIWADFPDFANLAAGHTVEGNLTAKDYNGKTYFALYPIKPNPMGTRPAWAGKKEGAITKAMETKAQNIATAQENREQGVKIASTMNKAIDIALAESGTPIVASDFQERVNYWRKWIYENWDAKDTDFAPF